MPSTRQQVLAALLARVQAIRVVNGYQTDVGQQVFIGETPELGEDDPDHALALVVEVDAVTQQAGKVLVTLPVECQALAKADLDAPHLAIEAMIADIKKAVEVDFTLGGLAPRQMRRGLTRALPREPGSLTVGASVTYVVPYDETWGAP